MAIESTKPVDTKRTEWFVLGSGLRNSRHPETTVEKSRAGAAAWPDPTKKTQREDALAMPPQIFGPDEWQRIVRTLGLSPREAEIAALVLYGMKDEAIAARLGIRKPTVRTHLQKMFQSLEVDSRIGLAMRIFAASRGVEEL